MKSITLLLTADLFKDQDHVTYISSDCPIGLACKKEGTIKYPQVACTSLRDKDTRISYEIKPYYFCEVFDEDYIKAEENGFDPDVVIRKVKLIPTTSSLLK